jgi:glyoxylase-like metal-dependent hydrolase (beta-lactamase superfamily II)
MLFALFAILNVGTLYGQSVNTKERSVTKVAEGIYMIRHPEAADDFPQGNTTVIIGDREVLVVDSCYLPSAAREDIAQIKQWTNKPVHYLVNTHWHNDHVHGNRAYFEAFPDLQIVAHLETQRQMDGFIPSNMVRFEAFNQTQKQLLESGKEQDGTPLTEARKKAIAGTLAGREKVWQEFKTFVYQSPTVTFNQEFTVNLGNREVQVKHLGRGNTAGDAVVYLPKEKLLLAGDLLDYPVPYLGGGFPSELVQTLKRMGQLDAETVIPGHGDLLRNKFYRNYLTLVIDFVSAIVAQVRQEVYRLGNGPRNLDKVREGVEKALDLAAWRQRFAGDNADNLAFFDSFSLVGVITAAYREMWGM